MNPFVLLSEAAAVEAASIPERSATVSESLKLVCEGWGSIFIVIIFMIGVIWCLNKVFNKAK